MKQTRLFITGGRGFIGGHLIRLLRKEIDFEVVQFQSDLLKLRVLPKSYGRIDVVIHAAGVNRAKDGDIISGNVVGTFQLLRTLGQQKNKPNKIIFLSSTQAGNDTVYGQSKLMAEMLIKEFSLTHKIPAVIFRLPNVFGEHGRPYYNSVVATFCYQIAHGMLPTIHDKKSSIPLLYVGDLVTLILRELKVSRRQLCIIRKNFPLRTVTLGDLSQLISRIAKRDQSLSMRTLFHRNLQKTYQSYE